jgi:hypothetical protein
MAASKRVNTATLIRGETYVVRHPDNTPANPRESLTFTRDVPKVIDEKPVLDYLEGLYDEIEDGDGEVYEKPRFRVERNVPEPEANEVNKPKRLAADRKVKRRTRRAS